MSKRSRGLWWYLHRALCCVGLHASGRIWAHEDEDWTSEGWLCLVCNKTWEEKKK